MTTSNSPPEDTQQGKPESETSFHNGAADADIFERNFVLAHLRVELSTLLRSQSRAALDRLRVAINPQNLTEQLTIDALHVRPPLPKPKGGLAPEELVQLIDLVVNDYLREFHEFEQEEHESAALGEVLSTLPNIESKPADEPLGVLASEVIEKQVEWLVGGLFLGGLFPRAKQSELIGDPDKGKTFFIIDFAAQISRAPEYQESKVPVAILSGEDDAADTLKPRLRVANADQERVRILNSAPRVGSDFVPVTFPSHIREVEELLRADGTVVLFVDPITAFLSEKYDPHKDGSIRKLLAHIRDLAERTRCAIVLLRHPNKMSSEERALYRGGGSIAFTAASRTGYTIGFDPDDQEPDSDRRRVLACHKNNLAPKPASRAFRLRSDEGDGGIAHIEWCKEPCNLTADDLFTRSRPHRDRDAPALTEAVAFLKCELGPGDRLKSEIVERAKECGISEATLNRACTEAKVRSYKNLFQGRSYWSLKTGAWSLKTGAPEDRGLVPAEHPENYKFDFRRN